MPKPQNEPLRFSLYRILPLALVALAFWLGPSSRHLAFGQALYGDEGTAEGWAWSKIRKGEWADFNQRCKARLDARVDDARWHEDCRTVSASFLQNLLTREPWQESTPYAGVRIKGARIVRNLENPTDFDLENAKLTRSIEIVGSRIEAGTNLRHVRTDYFISFNSSLLTDGFDAAGLRSKSDLSFADGSIFEGTLNLQGATVEGNLEMSGISVDGALDATGVCVDGSLEMSSTDKDVASFHDVRLNNARIAGNLTIRGASSVGAFDGANIVVGGDLSAAQTKFREKVELAGAKISGDVDVNNCWFDDDFHGYSIQVGGNLNMQRAYFIQKSNIAFGKITGIVDTENGVFNDELDAYAIQVGGFVKMKHAYFSGLVKLDFAKISGVFNLNDANFNGKLDAFRLQVDGYVAMQDTTFTDEVNMAFAKFDNNLDLNRATLQNLDLSGASIGGELQIGMPNNEAIWKAKYGIEPVINLRNAHIGNLADTKQAWPQRGKIYLSGVSIDHLGGTQGETEEDMLKRGANWWDNWAKLNIKYSPPPYSQLANAFIAMGDREDANEIRYRARENERAVALDDHKWGTYILLSALNYIAGYGIGLHAFYVLVWVLGLTAAGAAVLWWTVPEAGKQYKNPDEGVDRVRGLLWCFGASLSRLLPVVELKEFKGFFEDPDKAGLQLWQRVAFSMLGLAGWILGGVLILAVSGLTQNS